MQMYRSGLECPDCSFVCESEEILTRHFLAIDTHVVRFFDARLLSLETVWNSRERIETGKREPVFYNWILNEKVKYNT